MWLISLRNSRNLRYFSIPLCHLNVNMLNNEFILQILAGKMKHKAISPKAHSLPFLIAKQTPISYLYPSNTVHSFIWQTRTINSYFHTCNGERLSCSIYNWQNIFTLIILLMNGKVLEHLYLSYMASGRKDYVNFHWVIYATSSATEGGI